MSTENRISIISLLKHLPLHAEAKLCIIFFILNLININPVFIDLTNIFAKIIAKNQRLLVRRDYAAYLYRAAY
jgi:hypothetical protein